MEEAEAGTLFDRLDVNGLGYLSVNVAEVYWSRTIFGRLVILVAKLYTSILVCQSTFFFFAHVDH